MENRQINRWTMQFGTYIPAGSSKHLQLSTKVLNHQIPEDYNLTGECTLAFPSCIKTEINQGS